MGSTPSKDKPVEVRVYFKDEDEVKGQPVGPCLVETGPEPAPETLGRPYQSKCLCGDYAARAERSTESNAWGYPLCPDCGDELPPVWITLSEAEAIAAEHGVDLRIS